MSNNNINLNEIFEKLVLLQLKSYAKYSKYRVACYIQTDIGLIPGVNVEIGSYPLSVCAERTAFGNAISQGAKKFEALYLLTDTNDGFGTPCGGCRQVIIEFCDPETPIYIFNKIGEDKLMLAKDLLPFAWDNSKLK